MNKGTPLVVSERRGARDDTLRHTDAIKGLLGEGFEAHEQGCNDLLRGDL